MSQADLIPPVVAPYLAPEPFDLGQLGDALSWSGLGEYVGCFDPFSPRRADWQHHRDHAPERLRPLIDLFLLGRPAAPGALPELFRPLLAGLEALGLIQGGECGVAMTNGLAVLPVFGRWMMCHAPRANPQFYFGDDTVALLARLSPKAGGRCLDLCTGPGMLALHAAGIADRVVAVEQVPESARLARLNVDLNRLGRRIEVLEGDLYEPITQGGFDSIVANPPMLPFPTGLGEPAIGHGGEDGFRLTRRVLAGLPAMLRPGGAGQIIGVALSDGAAPLGLKTLEDATGGRLDLTLSILSHQPVREDAPYLDALVATVAAASLAEEDMVRGAYLAMMGRAGANALCHLFIHARHGAGQVEVIDVSSWNRATGWRWRR